jgi:hypothetical protein
MSDVVDLSTADIGEVLKQISRIKGYGKFLDGGNIPVLAFISKSQYDLVKFLHIDVSSLISKSIINMSQDNDGSLSPDHIGGR